MSKARFTAEIKSAPLTSYWPHFLIECVC